MEEEKHEIDRSKLKSFRDITNIQTRSCYTTRRNWPANLPSSPPHYIVKRIPNSPRENDPTSVNRLMYIRQPVFHTYECVRRKSTNIKGRSIYFTFSDGNKILFSAKFKSSSSVSHIPIVSGKNVHLKSDDTDAVLLYGNENCDFSLRAKNAFGNEILSLQFRRYENESRQPRRLSMFFFKPNEGVPEKLESAEPEQSDENTWCIDLNTDEAIKSIKNCRIENERHEPFEFVRKKSSNVLEIEARDTIDPICLFATTIASFLCKR